MAGGPVRAAIVPEVEIAEVDGITVVLGALLAFAPASFSTATRWRTTGREHWMRFTPPSTRRGCPSGKPRGHAAKPSLRHIRLPGRARGS